MAAYVQGGTATDEKVVADLASPDQSVPRKNAVMLDVAQLNELAELITRPGALIADSILDQLVDIAMRYSGANVGYARRLGHNRVLELATSVHLADGCLPAGEIPNLKHHDDCKCPFDSVGGGRRDHSLDDIAQRRERSDGQSFYSPQAIEHFAWIGSEAFIPLGGANHIPVVFIALGHRNPNYFDQDRLADLGKYFSLFQVFYRLGEFAEDRVFKSQFLHKVAHLLERFANAPSREAFQRAVCTVLTSGKGIGFDRSLLFWMENSELNAECQMAVGGIDDTWPEKRAIVGHFFEGKGLDGYVQYSLDYPVPGDGPCSLRDDLYDAICVKGKRLFFRPEDHGAIRQMYENGGVTNPPALRLTDEDPWIARIRRERPEVFSSRHNEYFLLPLKPFGEDAPVLGFVLADLPFKPQAHAPIPGFPDLEMAVIVVRLLAGMWQIRQNAESIGHVLTALPILQHGSPDLSHAVERLETAVERGESQEVLFARVSEVAGIKDELCNAKDIVEGLRDRQLTLHTNDLSSALRNFCDRINEKYSGVLICEVDSEASHNAVRTPPETLESILSCLVANVAKHGGKSSDLKVTIRCRTIEVPESGGSSSERILVLVENNGIPILDEMAKYLFVSRVSTSEEAGHGSGLSTARLQAAAYGGDLILDSNKPVSFGIVLVTHEDPVPAGAV